MLDTLSLWWMNLHFIRPWCFLLLPIVWIILYGLFRATSYKDAWKEVCDEPLLEILQAEQASVSREKKTGVSSVSHEGERPIFLRSHFWMHARWRVMLYPLSFLMVLSLTGPSFQQASLPVINNERPLIIVLETTPTMLSTDVKPSRLQRAKFAIQDILKEKKDGQFALLAYSDYAFVVTPLTDDKATILNLLSSINPSIMPVSGNDPVMALQKAERLIKQAGFEQGDVLFISDEIKSIKIENELQRLASQGIQTSILAIGTATGAPVQSGDGSLLRDSKGDVILTKVDLDAMQTLANLGGGVFASIGASNISSMNALQTYLQGATNASDPDFDQAREETLYLDHGYYLLILTLPLLLLCMRKGILLSMIATTIVLSVSQIQPVYAEEKQDLSSLVQSIASEEMNAQSGVDEGLHTISTEDSVENVEWEKMNPWKNADQQAFEFIQRLSKQDEKQNSSSKHLAPQVASSIKDQEIKAAYAYKMNDFESAIEHYQDILKNEATAKNYYNYGNALAQSGNLTSALDAYSEGIERMEESSELLENLQYNYDLVKKALDEQENQKKDGQSDQGNQDQSNQDQSNQDQSNQDQGNQDQGNQDQGNQDQGNQDQGSQDQGSQDQGNQDQSSQDQDALNNDKNEEDSESEAQDGLQIQKAIGKENAERKMILDQVENDPSILLRNKFRKEYLERNKR